MKKKLILAAAGAMAVSSLAACSSGSKDIATMKGSTITVDDFYNQIKEQSTSQQEFSQMVIYKVFDEKLTYQKELQAIKDRKHEAFIQRYHLIDLLKMSKFSFAETQVQKIEH